MAVKRVFKEKYTRDKSSCGRFASRTDLAKPGVASAIVSNIRGSAVPKPSEMIDSAVFAFIWTITAAKHPILPARMSERMVMVTDHLR